ncbi:NAD-dependent succinate-semialdehyde dehydrogenase [Novosphingobium aerophilum]|uniref:NAD-dependent succinate-semialdehyde dehydrogenase n=1 Tax=Novosphingobium aerophilum TaxID=2839843 RepID=A0A7X1FAL4_9SPHN|nr:NAD-dependent succinate-semialdehyde dehydrogenase [Novosphingobium aerophilum]MBC2653473.1 NAD-dependent succinate-semialdehyde dehydrogenase [Novosphingobium aerophilum]
MTAMELPAKISKPPAALMHERAYVGGAWVGADDCRPVTNPSTRETLGHVPALTRDTVTAAISAASQALPAWKAMLAPERAAILMHWHDLILSNADDLAELLTFEQGKPFADAQGEIAYGAGFIKWFAAEAQRTYGDVIPSHLPNRKLFTQQEPLGVVALVTPWNFPSAMLTRKAGAALAAGCTAICVPSMETPFSALALADLAEQAGIPAGVFNVLTGDAGVIVPMLCEEPVVRGLSFTGSTEIGRLIARTCGATVKRLSLELGGHAPFIVCADADPESAARAAVDAKFQTSGQDCLAANRIFVHRDIVEDFTRHFVHHTQLLKVADGFERGAQLGPLIHDRAVDKCMDHIEDAVSKGARLLHGGARMDPDSLFFEPAVLADVTDAMKIYREETFGPVAAITPFEDDAAVIVAANDSEYGLAAYVFTRDLSRAVRMSEALEFGMVAINTVKFTGAPIPFGGIKQSGLGREGARQGIEEFLETKYVCMAI